MKIIIKTNLLIFLILSLAIPAFAGWPFYTQHYHNYRTPAIGDLDSDGVLDLVFGSMDGNIYAVDAGGNLKWANNFFKDSIGINTSSPTLADVDNDPTTLETIVGSGTDTYGLVILSHTGQVLAEYPGIGIAVANPVLVVDADFNGEKEIYLQEKWKISAFNIVKNGGAISLQPRFSLNVRGPGPRLMPAAADIIKPKVKVCVSSEDCHYGEGLEIVFAESEMKAVEAYTNTGKLIWRKQINYRPDSSPVITDLDNDGKLEVLVMAGPDIYSLNANTGTEKWKRTYYSRVFQTPAVGDIIGNDGLKEIVIAFNNSMFLLDCNGNEIWRKDFIGDPLSGTLLSGSSPTIVDLNGDGDKEIVFGTAKVYFTPIPPNLYPNAYVVALDKNGNTVWQVLQDGSIPSSSISVADLDGNGKNDPELCFGEFGNSNTQPPINGFYNCLNGDGSQFQLYSPGSITDFQPWTSMHKNNQNIRLFN